MPLVVTTRNSGVYGPHKQAEAGFSGTRVRKKVLDVMICPDAKASTHIKKFKQVLPYFARSFDLLWYLLFFVEVFQKYGSTAK